MKWLVVGSRSITHFDLSPYIPLDVDVLITGGAKGVDTLAEAYADMHKLSKIVLRPQYHRYGRGAPIQRNKAMVDLADCILVIWDGNSKGSQTVVDYAHRTQKEVTVICVSADKT